MAAAQALYANWFQIADADRDGRVGGGEAISFLLRSELPKETLRRIWELADESQSGFLDSRSFGAAMQLVSIARACPSLPAACSPHCCMSLTHSSSLVAESGQVLRDDHVSKLRTGGIPAPPPPRLRGLEAAPLTPAAAPPSSMLPGGGGASLPWPPLGQEEAQRYAASLKKCDLDGDGYVTGLEAKPYFSSARVANTVRGLRRASERNVSQTRAPPFLPQGWYKLIWDLADTGAKGSLSLPEWCVASYFLDKAVAGRPPPPALPPAVFPPPALLLALGQPTPPHSVAAPPASALPPPADSSQGAGSRRWGFVRSSAGIGWKASNSAVPAWRR